MATAKKKTTKKSTTSKKDLEAKIADLEAKLNKLAAAQGQPFTTALSLHRGLAYKWGNGAARAVARNNQR